MMLIAVHCNRKNIPTFEMAKKLYNNACNETCEKPSIKICAQEMFNVIMFVHIY